MRDCRSSGAAVILIAGVLAAGAAHARGAAEHQLGPTGLIGTISKTTVKVTKVEKGSPADGKVKVGDEIIGAGESNFKKNVRHEMADAIDEAEKEEAGGRLTLTLKGGKKVTLKLEVLGSYSDTAPYDCPKSEKIIARAAEYLVKSGRADRGCLHPGLLGLMATGEQKYIDVVAKIIQDAKWAKPNPDDFNALLAGDKDMGYVGWYWGYILITLSEYHLLTGDESVLPAIKTYAVSLARGQDAGGLWGHRMATVKRNGRLPGYAQMNQNSLTCFMGMLLARKCGIDDPKLIEGIERTHAFYATFIGKGAFNYGVHGPNTRTYNNNGTSGSGALCMSFKGNRKGAAFFSKLASTSYGGLETGHASIFFNPLWTPLGANVTGPEVTKRYFKKSRWLQTMYRSWEGNFTFNGKQYKEGDQSGVALLAYCLPRRAIYITGKNADKSLWLNAKAATEAVEMSQIDYKSKSNDELMALAKHPIPQVSRAAGGTLCGRRDALTPTWIKFLKEGTSEEKQLAIGQYGWWIPIDKRLPRVDDIGAILRDTNEKLEVRVAAAGSLAHMGKPAHKYYMDMVRLAAEDRPWDRFGDIDWSLGGSINTLCKEPFKEGLVTDKALLYKVALKLANFKRQHVRADGLRMIAEIPLEDFHLVADTVMHIIKDRDPTYHSYHSPGGPVGAAITILANLGIKEGMQYTLDVLDTDSGKWGFKVRMVCSVLGKYGANAKPFLDKLRADARLKNVEKGKFRGGWNAMVKAIEGGKTRRKLISFEEAKRAGR